MRASLDVRVSRVRLVVCASLWRRSIRSRPCTPREAFTHLQFDNANLVRSNLGGQGGRCIDQDFGDGTSVTWQDASDEQQSPAMPQEVYVRIRPRSPYPCRSTPAAPARRGS